MTGHHTLAETERAMETHLSGLGIDMAAAETLSNLHRAATIVRNHFTKTVLREADLTWTSFVVLWVTWMWDNIETRHAAEEAAISKATLTGVVQTLERRGLIERSSDKQDRRLVHLALTDKGRELMEWLFPRFNAEEANVVSCLGARRQAEMTKGLKTIVATLEKNGGRPPRER